MITAELPAKEDERLNVLKELGLLDTVEERIFDDITRLAADICGTPISLITLVDEKRQWFKSHYGLEIRETPREVSFCSHAILDDNVMIVGDSREDIRFSDNPLVIGTPYVVFYAGAPLTLPVGHRVGTLCVIDHAPKLLTQRQRDLLKALADHVVELILLRSRVEAKDIWMAILSHELRSPLNSILGFAAILQDDPESISQVERRGCVEAIVRSSKLLLGLADDLVDLYRIQADFLIVNCHRIKALPVAGEVCADLQPMATKFEKVLEIVNSSDDWECVADRRRLKQVLLNLLSNAIKYSKEKSIVKVSCEEDPGQDVLRIHVSNEGEGITPEEIPSLFQQFGRLSHRSEVGCNQVDGIGMGLFLTKKIVEKMNGELTVSSVPHRLTVFTVCLPRSSSL